MFVEKDYKMKIKQQKQIEEFLNEEFETEKGKEIFDKVDNVTYGELKKLGFSRTKTLGYGKECCDFHFYKK